MVREDLVNSAVSFLQDPSVLSSPIEKRIEFLQSKNLTQDEIEVALARAGADGSSQSSQGPVAQSNYAYRPPPNNYGQYPPPPPGYWQQPPPELPRRDWRDWFIMATVMGGVGYGLYFTAKRYLLPLIAPPTPPQLEQDKNNVTTQFDRAFALIDQLATDTVALKESEEKRTQKLDAALEQLETVISSLKQSSQKRDDDTRRIESDVRGLRDLIPKAMEAQKESSDNRLKELGSELKSLKTLIGNRMAPPPSPAPQVNGATPTVEPQAPSVTSPPVQPPTSNGISSFYANRIANNTSPSNASSTPNGSSNGSSVPNRAAIPAWQMAAAKKATATPVEDDTNKSEEVATTA